MKTRRADAKSGKNDKATAVTVGGPPLGWTVPVDASRARGLVPDRFGHQRYVKTIIKVVADAPEGMTIGLFGGYGTGKTWVVNELVNSLNVPGSDTRVVQYDAWRYADDEFRRDFLVHLRAELAELGALNADAPGVDASVFRIESAIKLEEPPKFQFGALLRAMWQAPAYVLLAGGVLGVVGAAIGFATGGTPGAGAGVSVGLAAGFMWALQEARVLLSLPMLTLKKITETKHPPIELPEEFLNTFNGIVSSRNCETLIIVLDNLDRCSPEVGMKVLSTVKNFLEPGKQRVFFLIPCDREAIERHLSALFKGRGLEGGAADADAREYLDKLFSATVTMAPFDTSQLEGAALYILERLKSMEAVPEPDRQVVAAIAATACRRSPRQVATFLNKVSSSLALLMESPEAAKQLPPPKVAKLVALREFAPSLWDAISGDVTALARFESNPDEWNSASNRNDNSGGSQPDEGRRLLRGLQIVQVGAQDIQTFIGLDLPPESRVIPRYQEVVAAVEDADMEALDSLVADASPEVLQSAMVNVVAKRVRERERAAAPQLAERPVLAGLHLAARADMPSLARDRFLSDVSAEVLGAVLPRLGPAGAVAVVAAAPRHPRSSAIMNHLCDGLAGDQYPDKGALLQALERAEAHLLPSHIATLNRHVAALLASDITFEESLRHLSPEFKRRIVSAEAQVSLVGSFTRRTAESAAPSELLAALDRLDPHVDLLSAEDVGAIAAHAAQQLVPRASSDAIAPEDLELYQRVVGLAATAEIQQFDGLSEVAQVYCATTSDRSRSAVISALGSVDFTVGPDSQRCLVDFVRQLLGGGTSTPPVHVISQLGDLTGCLSAETAAGVLESLAAGLQADGDEKAWNLAADLGRVTSSWSPMNEAVKRVITSAPAHLPWIAEWADDNFDEERLQLAFADVLPLLDAPLAQPATAAGAAELGVQLAVSAPDGDRKHLMARATQLLGKANADVAEANAMVVESLMDGATDQEKTDAKTKLIETVTAGRFDVAPTVHRLRLVAAGEHATASREPLRKAIATGLRSTSGEALAQCVDLAYALLGVSGGLRDTAEQFFTAAIETAASDAPGTDAATRIAVAESCWRHMSKPQRAAAADDLRAVAAKHPLPAVLAAAAGVPAASGQASAPKPADSAKTDDDQ